VQVESGLNIIPGTCAVIAILTWDPTLSSLAGETSAEMKEVTLPTLRVVFSVPVAAVACRPIWDKLRSGPSCPLFADCSDGACSDRFSDHSGRAFVGKMFFLVASNAAVGRPATAAAFSGRIPKVQFQWTLYGGDSLGRGRIPLVPGGITMYRALQNGLTE
jgi:hypothetical protein